MKCLCQYMMDILFCYFIKNFTANLQIGSDIAFAETVISFKKDFFGKAMMHYVSLNYFKHILIASCKTGTTQTNDDFTAMIH